MPDYQVLYRKYRPQSFSEVVGQDHIVSVLQRQVASGRVAHAYLFSGPRGVGKTTVARIIAKAANCADFATPRSGEQQNRASAKAPLSGGASADYRKGIPCNECASCVVFNGGQALNLIEIDAASNRGIDDIRELREAVRFAPVAGGTKVYIIDEVHQLSKDAFSALLKTLEEPPGHVVFVLATTELDKVPETIVSRTQHFDFRRVRSDVVSDRLIDIAKREGFSLELAAARIIAFAAEGSVRDAESMLGKIMAVAEATITETAAEEVLGIPKREAIVKLFDLIGAKNLARALELVNQLYHDGYDLEYLTKMLVAFFRDALLATVDPAFHPTRAGSLLPAEGPELAQHLAHYTAADLAGALLELMQALAAAKRSPIPQLPLELALVNIMSSHATTREQ